MPGLSTMNKVIRNKLKLIKIEDLNNLFIFVMYLKLLHV